MYHHYFPEELTELRIEIDHHPDLLTILTLQADSDFYVHLAEIAAYCGIALNGDFSQTEILKLCDLCTQTLKAKRISVVVLPH